MGNGVTDEQLVAAFNDRDRAGRAGAVRSRIRRLSDEEKIVFADAALRWIDLGGTIKLGALGFPPILTEDDLDGYKALALTFIFPDGERSIWVRDDCPPFTQVGVE